MFFFFAGGLEQQAGHVIKKGVGRCINCNSTLDLVQYDKVLKLFFVPVKRWPGKDPILHCPDCKLFYPHSFSPPPSAAVPDTLRCQSCGGDVEDHYKFCPFCGVSR